jgi:hypothetical protein
LRGGELADGDVGGVMRAGGSGASGGAIGHNSCGSVACAGAVSVAQSPSTASSSSVDISTVPTKPRAHQGPGAPLPPQSIVQFVTASSAQYYPVRASVNLCQPGAAGLGEDEHAQVQVLVHLHDREEPLGEQGDFAGHRRAARGARGTALW